MNNRIPDEMLLHIFSFLNKKSNSLSPLSRVCKDWYRVANEDQLWLQLIRPEYQDRCKNIGYSAKEFYKYNIDARIDTYYLIGLPVKTADINWQGMPHSITVDKLTLLQAFPQSEKIKIFYSREDAIKWADVLSKVDETALNNTWYYIYHYRPVFTIQINTSTLIPSQLDIQNESFYQNCGREALSDQCFEIDLSQVNKLYSLVYKTGKLTDSIHIQPHAEKQHELILNQQMNQENQITQEHKEKNKPCRIQ